MTRYLVHEPSYVSGTYANEDVGLSVGWVSHGGSSSDCMPLWNERRDVCLIFSGEDFMDVGEVSQWLHGFGSGNAKYLITLYEAMGLRFIEKLNGWFSGLLVDVRRHLAVLLMTATGSAEFTITRIQTVSISRPRPSRFSKFYPACVDSICVGSQKPLPAAVCCKTGPFSRASHCSRARLKVVLRSEWTYLQRKVL